MLKLNASVSKKLPLPDVAWSGCPRRGVPERPSAYQVKSDSSRNAAEVSTSLSLHFRHSLRHKALAPVSLQHVNTQPAIDANGPGELTRPPQFLS